MMPPYPENYPTIIQNVLCSTIGRVAYAYRQWRHGARINRVAHETQVSVYDQLQSHVMTDESHLMTYEIHFMTEPTYGFFSFTRITLCTPLARRSDAVVTWLVVCLNLNDRQATRAWSFLIRTAEL